MLSIIVISYNRKNSIQKCIDALLEQTTKYDEIIVVDSNSTDGTLELLNNYGEQITLLLIEKHIKNRSYSRNYGAKYAKNPYLLFVDSDVIILENCIDSYKEAYQNNTNIVGAYSSILAPSFDDTTFKPLVGTSFDELFDTEKFSITSVLNNPRLSKEKIKTYNSRDNWIYFYSGLCSVKKEVFDKLSGFDEEFRNWGSEDIDLGYRLKKYGRLQYINGAKALHYPHYRNYNEIYYENKKNQFFMLEKHQNSDMEINVSLGFSTSNKLYIDRVKEELVDTYEFSNFPNIINDDCFDVIYISTTSKELTSGAVKIKINGVEKFINLMGLALPFDNNTFDYAILSSQLLSYDELLLSQILQESIRISKHVIMDKEHSKQSVYLEEENSLFKPSLNAKYDKLYFNADTLKYFRFIEYDNYFYIAFYNSVKNLQIHKLRKHLINVDTASTSLIIYVPKNYERADIPLLRKISNSSKLKFNDIVLITDEIFDLDIDLNIRQVQTNEENIDILNFILKKKSDNYIFINNILSDVSEDSIFEIVYGIQNNDFDVIYNAEIYSDMDRVRNLGIVKTGDFLIKAHFNLPAVFLKVKPYEVVDFCSTNQFITTNELLKEISNDIAPILNENFFYTIQNMINQKNLSIAVSTRYPNYNNSQLIDLDHINSNTLFDLKGKSNAYKYLNDNRFLFSKTNYIIISYLEKSTSEQIKFILEETFNIRILFIHYFELKAKTSLYVTCSEHLSTSATPLIYLIDKFESIIDYKLWRKQRNIKDDILMDINLNMLNFEQYYYYLYNNSN